MLRLSASASPQHSLEISLTESSRHIPSDLESKVTTIALKKSELTVHEHVELLVRRRPPNHDPPDLDVHRTLDADELGKVRALLDESGLIAHGNVDASRPRGGCGGVEYHLELRVDIDGKRVRRDIRGLTVESCRKDYSLFLGSRAFASARHFVDGLKALVDSPP